MYLTDEQREEASKMLAHGASLVTVAKYFGITVPQLEVSLNSPKKRSSLITFSYRGFKADQDETGVFTEHMFQIQFHTLRAFKQWVSNFINNLPDRNTNPLYNDREVYIYE